MKEQPGLGEYKRQLYTDEKEARVPVYCPSQNTVQSHEPPFQNILEDMVDTNIRDFYYCKEHFWRKGRPVYTRQKGFEKQTNKKNDQLVLKLSV